MLGFFLLYNYFLSLLLRKTQNASKFTKQFIRKDKCLIHENLINIYSVDTKRILLLFNKKTYNKILDMILVIMVLGLPIRNTIAKYFENSKNIVLLVHDNYILNKDE